MNEFDGAQQLLRAAAQDLAAAEVMAGEERVSDAIVGFHCQQAVEKACKAFLQGRDILYPKTHDLRMLLRMSKDAGLEKGSIEAELADLTDYAVGYRYEPWQLEAPVDRMALVKLAARFLELIKKELPA